MEFTPVPAAQAAALVVAFYAWAVYRFWLGLRFARREEWSPRWDGFSLGMVASAGVVVAQRVLGL